MSAPIIASLDLGSNTFRLMLAGNSGAGWKDKRVFQHIPRLSENLTNGGHFAPAALERAWAALDDFAARVRAAGAVKALACATMAARLAADGPAFMAAVRSRYGWEAEIISGDEEARLTAIGVLSELTPLPENALIFDIGGRSTEFVSARGRELVKSRSLDVGVVKLTETFLSDPSAPAVPAELARLAEAAREILNTADFSDAAPGAVLVGTAGTVTTLAAMLLGLREYRPELVDNSRLARAKIIGLLAEVGRLDVAARIERYGLHPRRADAIVAGLALVLEIMSFLGREELVVSDNGLLEGAWLKAAGLI
jgi:exopolyphosphatase/guanosine-5'-triphosphate,3'-diphosphate pyrophosphatase